MDAGKVAEFDTVLNLYDTETSIFRHLCNEANLRRGDVVRIRAEALHLNQSPACVSQNSFHFMLHSTSL